MMWQNINDPLDKRVFLYKRHNFMETLLDKVKIVEEEINGRLKQIDSQGKKQVADFISTEKDVVEAVRMKAEGEGKELIKEQVQKAHAETNAMKQDREKSLVSIQDGAKRNRSNAVEKIVDIFRKTYLD